MIPADFDYTAPDSIDGVLSALADGGEEAKILAGGHSLIPLMKLRLATPALLVDLRKVEGLRGVTKNGSWSIGAMTPHSETASSGLGLISAVAGTIADPQVRHRGTIGGSIVHGDPASDLPAALLAAEATVKLRGSGGERSLPAAELFVDYLTTNVGPDEVMTSVEMPSLDGWGFSYQKFNRRAEDWAMVAVPVLVKASGGVCEDVRIGLTNMGSRPLRATAAEEALRGKPLDAASIEAAAKLVDEGTDPPGDLNATADYKRHLARVLCKRGLMEAAAQQ
jgi:aerobic carbon-monoxide dehydrogenase medium subunit